MKKILYTIAMLCIGVYAKAQTPCPTINLGPDRTECLYKFGFFTIDIPIDPSGLTWSSADKDDRFGEFAGQASIEVYTPSELTKTRGKGVIYVSNSGEGCVTTYDTLVINFKPSPYLELGPDTTICSSKDTIFLHAQTSGSIDSIKWIDPSGKVISYASGPSLTYVSTTQLSEYVIQATAYTANGCNTTDSILIIVNSSGTVNAGPDQSVISGNVVHLEGKASSSSFNWVTTGTGTFTGGNTLTPLYTPSTADFAKGKVLMMLNTSKSGSCGYNSDTVEINFVSGFSLQASVSTGQDILENAVAYLYENTGSSYVLQKTQPIKSQQFLFDTLSNGQYLLLVVPGSTKYLPTYYKSSADWNTATPISISGQSVEIQVAPVSFIPPDTLWNKGKDTITGTVTEGGSNLRTAAGIPLANATVLLLDNSGQPLSFTRTDANGKYVFSNVAAGQYSIKVDYPGTYSNLVSTTTDGNPATASIADVATQPEVVQGVSSSTVHASMLQVYPNPVKDQLMYSLPAESSEGMATVTDSKGIVVYQRLVEAQTNTQLLNLQTLPAGIYVLQVIQGANVYSGKFSKVE